MVHQRLPLRSYALAALASAAGMALLALAFSGWLAHGSAIFLTMAESGLSWCF